MCREGSGRPVALQGVSGEERGKERNAGRDVEKLGLEKLQFCSWSWIVKCGFRMRVE